MSLFDDQDEWGEEIDHKKFDEILERCGVIDNKRVNDCDYTTDGPSQQRKKQRQITSAGALQRTTATTTTIKVKNAFEHIMSASQQLQQQQQQQQLTPTATNRISPVKQQNNNNNNNNNNNTFARASILVTETLGRVRIQLGGYQITPSIIEAFDKVFIAHNNNDSSSSYQRSKEGLVTWDIPHQKQDELVMILKRENVVQDVAQPHPIARRAMRFINNTINSSDVERMYLENIPKEFRDAFFPFQIDGVKFALERQGRALIADEMGLGKTIQALALCQAYATTDWPCTIFCPTSLKDTWRQQILRWVFCRNEEEEEKNDKLFKIEPLTIVKIETLKDVRELLLLNENESKNIKFIIVPYSMVAKLQNELNDLIFGKLKSNVVVCDESHFLKDRKAKRTEAVVPFLKRAKRAICLTGTPALARPIELFAQLESIQPAIFPNVGEFGQRYCSGGRFGPFSGSSQSDELYRILSSTTMIRRKKKDVLTQLPPKQREQIFIEIPKKGADKAKLFAIQNAIEHAKTELERKMLMNRYYLETAEVKKKYIQDYLQTILESSGEEKKILFFAHHKILLEAAKETMEKTKTKFIQIDGSTNSNDRQRLVDEFQKVDSSSSSPRVAVLSIKAAGVGLTLTAASLVIFGEYSWTPSDLLQAEDRAHRIGQRDSVHVQYLHLQDSVDDIVWGSIKNKLGNIGRFLDGDNDGYNRMDAASTAVNRRKSFDSTQKTLDGFVNNNSNIVQITSQDWDDLDKNDVVTIR